MAVITYTLTGDPLVQLRLHIKRCNVLDTAKYRKALREVNVWVVEQTGKPVDQWTEADWQLFEDDNTAPMFRVGEDRAAMLTALDKIERKDGDGEWALGALPEEWWGIEGFATEMPPQLYYAWREAAYAANPGLFGVGMSDDEKKSGHLSVS